MELNDNKAGMQGLDKEKINQIIHQASKGSKFYENEMKKEKQVNTRIEEQKRCIEQLLPDKLKYGQEMADKLLKDLESSRDLSHSIVHLDMDMFYAAVEMRDDPSLKNKPMAVGSPGMLSTSNYAARRFGVRAAMPGFIGKKLCPELVIVPCHFDKYREVSGHIREILAEYDPNYCPMSLDEAYFDLTSYLSVKRPQLTEAERSFVNRLQDQETTDRCDDKDNDNNACVCSLSLHPHTQTRPESQTSSNQITETISTEDDSKLSHTESHHRLVSEESRDNKTCGMCGRRYYLTGQSQTFGFDVEEVVQEIRFRIHQRTKITASAGIAPNLMLAKICSDKNKPNGQFRLMPDRDRVMQFVNDLQIRKVGGIGKVTEKMLKSLGIVTCLDLFTKRDILYYVFSPTSFYYFMRVCLGIAQTYVTRGEERKSMSVERTFQTLSEPKQLFDKCRELSLALANDLNEEGIKGKTVTLKIKTIHFDVKTKAQTLALGTSDPQIIHQVSSELLSSEIAATKPNKLALRLMGIRMSNLVDQSRADKHQQKTIIGFFTQGNSSDLDKGQDNNDKQVSSSHISNNISVKAPTKCAVADYVCPVCDGKIECCTLEQFNRHIDQCIALNINKTDESEDKLTPATCTLLSTSQTHKDVDVTSLSAEFSQCASSVKSSSFSAVDNMTEATTKNSAMVEVNNSAMVEVNNSAMVEVNDSTMVKVNDSAMVEVNDSDIGHTKDSVIGEARNSSDVEENQVQINEEGCSSGPKTCFDCPVCEAQLSDVSLDTFNGHVDTCLSRSAIRDLVKEENYLSQQQILKRKLKTNEGKSGSCSSNKRRKLKVDNSKSISTFFTKIKTHTK